MYTFFEILKKSLVATVFIMFALAATYVPQPYSNNVPVAHAGSAVAGALEPTQILNNIELLFNTVYQVLEKGIAAADLVISEIIEWKEFIGDGLAWILVKGIVSNMLDDLISWVNSGFNGSPAFVQDIDGFLLATADQASNEYIQRLGSVGSYICEPFRLDVQTAIAQQYSHTRVNNEPESCTVNNVVLNMEDFLDGTSNSFVDNGGWDQWFAISSDPTMYTSYGSALKADSSHEANILTQQGEDFSFMNFGSGFLSSETCTLVTTAAGTTEDCEVNTPGKIIEEALSFNLDSGRQSLVQADELNEVIASVITNLANNVFSSANGLLDF